jgi:hypothetical protein
MLLHKLAEKRKSLWTIVSSFQFLANLKKTNNVVFYLVSFLFTEGELQMYILFTKISFFQLVYEAACDALILKNGYDKKLKDDIAIHKDFLWVYNSLKSLNKCTVVRPRYLKKYGFESLTLTGCIVMTWPHMTLRVRWGKNYINNHKYTRNLQGTIDRYNKLRFPFFS